MPHAGVAEDFNDSLVLEGRPGVEASIQSVPPIAVTAKYRLPIFTLTPPPGVAAFEHERSSGWEAGKILTVAEVEWCFILRWRPKGAKEMGYIEQSLVPGETVVYRARLHWIIFLWPVIFLFIALLSFLGGRDSAGVGAFFLIVSLIWGIRSYVKFTSSEFGLTNRRLLVKVGSVRRHSLELMLPKLESIGVDQGIPGRIFGYGTIIVGGTGGTKEPFPAIAAPMEFRRMVQQQAATSQ